MYIMSCVNSKCCLLSTTQWWSTLWPYFRFPKINPLIFMQTIYNKEIYDHLKMSIVHVQCSYYVSYVKLNVLFGDVRRVIQNYPEVPNCRGGLGSKFDVKQRIQKV